MGPVVAVGDLIMPKGATPELMHGVTQVRVPEGHGVIFTALRFLPADGSWEIARAGQWETEWTPFMYEEVLVPELDEHGLVPEDWDRACQACGHDDVAEARSVLVYARPAQPRGVVDGRSTPGLPEPR